MGGREDICNPLAALAAELATTEAAVAGLEDTIARLVAAGLSTDAGLQVLDRLRQTLADLAAFTAVLAATGEGEADLAAALTHVQLGDLAARLAGGTAPTGEDEFWDF